MKKKDDSQLSITANLKKGNLNTLFTFSGKGCDEAMGFYWMFGDGQSAHRDHLGIPEQHQYRKPGNYTVTLEAFGTDNNLIASAKKRVKVESEDIHEVIAKYKERCMTSYKSSNEKSRRSHLSS